MRKTPFISEIVKRNNREKLKENQAKMIAEKFKERNNREKLKGSDGGVVGVAGSSAKQ